jgi:hypothetical protein
MQITQIQLNVLNAASIPGGVTDGNYRATTYQSLAAKGWLSRRNERVPVRGASNQTVLVCFWSITPLGRKALEDAHKPKPSKLNIVDARRLGVELRRELQRLSTDLAYPEDIERVAALLERTKGFVQ